MEKIIEKLILIFEEYVTLLEENNGQDWANEMKGILLILNDDTLSLKERFYEVKSKFRSMLGGMGTLNDFIIWHDDKEEMLRLNKKLDQLKDSAGDILWRGLIY